ncbi:hypothetical protein WJX74_009357 [Apatococcus lobatus]|uniref:protein-S-isoprenylcysteine alpha-carbonyl methylesterase n=1 Tax=Apatococcus lobatus TaxID=904363 RepID=A0AAW1RQ04_9CHLO
MSVLEALKGAQLELSAIPSYAGKAARLSQLTRLLAGELFGMIRVIPFGVRAFWTYRRLPLLSRTLHAGHTEVTISRGLRYAPAERTLMDVYAPATQRVHGRLLPVALFCHGGVWAHGERWHYAPMAKRLAQAGILTAVIGYSLYPQASTHQMGVEVSQALSWIQDHAGDYGGNPEKISLVGHSAGAHLAMMALLGRAKAARAQKMGKAQATSDARLPSQLIGMCGVYDIARHYAYEEGRGVASLSTMKRAVGGAAGFAAASPAVILAQAAPSQASDGQAQSSTGKLSAITAQLQGRALGQAVSQARPGLFAAPTFQKGSAADQRNTSRTNLPPAPSSPSAIAGGLSDALQSEQAKPVPDTAQQGSSLRPTRSEPASQPAIMSFSLEEASMLPPVILMHGVQDLTVPRQQSLEMAWQLHDAKVAHEQLLYKDASHADFATDWHPLPSTQAQPAHQSPDFAADLIHLLGGSPK